MMVAVENCQAVILAGGFGTRLRAVVSDVPKPMANINGRPFLCYLLDTLKSRGIENVFISVGYKAEKITDFFGDYWEGLKINYAFEETPLGTGGALVNVAKSIDYSKPIFIFNGDTFFPINLKTMLRNHIKKNADISLATFSNIDTKRYSGVGVDSNSNIINFNKPSCKYCNGGTYLFSPSVIKRLQSMPLQNFSLENEIFPKFMSEKFKLVAFLDSCLFVDIGIPRDFAKASQLLKNHF